MKSTPALCYWSESKMIFFHICITQFCMKLKKEFLLKESTIFVKALLQEKDRGCKGDLLMVNTTTSNVAFNSAGYAYTYLLCFGHTECLNLSTKIIETLAVLLCFTIKKLFWIHINILSFYPWQKQSPVCL